jgi:hypothetical protein
MAQGAKGRSWQAGPSGQSTNQTSCEHAKGTGGPIVRTKNPIARDGKGSCKSKERATNRAT